MPTDEKITQITSTQALDDSDLMLFVHNMATTPVTKGKRVDLSRRGLLKDTTIISGMRLIWSSSTQITIDVGWCFAENGDFINATSQIVKSGLSLSSSTWYHVYTYLSGGAAAAEVVTTAPATWKGTAFSKTADTTRRYLGSVRTDGSGNLIAFTHDVQTNAIYYASFNPTASPFRCLSAGTATTATAVALSTAIPVTSFYANILVRSTGNQIMYVGTTSLTSSTDYYIALVAGNTTQQHVSGMYRTNALQQVYYLFAAALGSGSGNIDVLGYQFWR